MGGVCASGTSTKGGRTTFCGNLITNYLSSKRNGFCACGVNDLRQLIAVADYGLEPEIQVYKMPSKELLFKFKGRGK